jgi:hypothetical protein
MIVPKPKYADIRNHIGHEQKFVIETDNAVDKLFARFGGVKMLREALTLNNTPIPQKTLYNWRYTSIPLKYHDNIIRAGYLVGIIVEKRDFYEV